MTGHYVQRHYKDGPSLIGWFAPNTTPSRVAEMFSTVSELFVVPEEFEDHALPGTPGGLDCENVTFALKYFKVNEPTEGNDNE